MSRSGRETHVRAFETLNLWRQRSRDLTPYFFYADLLNARGGRARLLARLGAEAGDAIEEFLRLALTRESTEAPSLLRFLQYVENGDFEVKRDMEAAAQSIRVMTVHAAKGLEAKIVILPDTCQKPSDRFDPKLFQLSSTSHGQFLAWSPRKELDCHPVSVVRDQLRKERMNEYRRLLYVAMTRAEERLYVMGCHGAQEPPDDCWHAMIWRSLEGRLTARPAFWNDAEKVWRVQFGRDDAGLADARGAKIPSPATTTIPDWLREPVQIQTEEPTNSAGRFIFCCRPCHVWRPLTARKPRKP